MKRSSPDLLNSLSIALLYVVLGSVWVAFSDQILVTLLPGMTLETLTRFQTLKGVAYVLATAVLLFALVRYVERSLQNSEEASRELEHRYRQGFEAIGAVILLIDAATGAIVDANPAAERFYGWNRGALIGRKIGEINTLAEHEVRSEMQAAVQQRRAYFIFRHRLANGELRDVEVHTSPFDLGGRQHLLSIIHDITHRRRVEEDLARSERRYRQLLDEASDAVVLADGQGLIQEANPRATALFGLARMELRSMTIPDLLSGDNPSGRPLALGEIAPGKPLLVERDIRRSDGSVLPLEIHAMALADGTIQAIVRDITDRRALENQLRQAQKMEAVGQLTGGIAHDLNNILTVVQANAELIEASLDPAQEEARRDLDELQRAAHSGGAMIRKLLSFSRQSHLSPVPLEPGALVRELEPTLLRLLPASLEVRIVDRAEGNTIMADPVAFEQILLNLCTNSRDAMPSGGSLSIALEPRRIHPDAARPWRVPGNHIALVVRDTGIGMDSAAQLRVFEPFYTTKASSSGTGLGMPMVFGLARQHGGFVELESEVGRGTTVAVYFPMSRDGAGRATDPAPRTRTGDARPPALSDVPGGSETILLVEDEQSLRRAARRILERLGYEVLTARDGEEAAVMMRDQRDQIDLVLADIVLPKMAGGTFNDLIRQSGWRGRVLLTSGYSVSDAAWAGIELDADAPFLAKPWTFEELAGKIRQVLDRSLG